MVWGVAGSGIRLQWSVSCRNQRGGQRAVERDKQGGKGYDKFMVKSQGSAEERVKRSPTSNLRAGFAPRPAMERSRPCSPGEGAKRRWKTFQRSTWGGPRGRRGMRRGGGERGASGEGDDRHPNTASGHPACPLNSLHALPHDPAPRRSQAVDARRHFSGSAGLTAPSSPLGTMEVAPVLTLAPPHLVYLTPSCRGNHGGARTGHTRQPLGQGRVRVSGNERDTSLPQAPG